MENCYPRVPMQDRNAWYNLCTLIEERLDALEEKVTGENPGKYKPTHRNHDWMLDGEPGPRRK